jgi:hypothetical protein
MILTAKNISEGWGVVVHACNPTYSGGRDEEIAILVSLGKNVKETPSQQTIWVGDMCL